LCDIVLFNGQRSGARYQASAEQFIRAGVDTDRIPEISRKAVELAEEARQAFLAKRTGVPSSSRSSPKIALSIGAYGAALPNAEEYFGLYPPPYGPHGFELSSQSNDPSPPRSNVYNASLTPTPEERAAEQAAEDALYKWYLARLFVYASVPSIWSSIDILAFETIPLAREARAIRRAVGEVFAWSGAEKPWWIGFTFPDGEFPEKQFVNGPPMHIAAVLDAIFSVPAAGGTDRGAVPSAIGINCTSPSVISPLIKEMSCALSNAFLPTRSSPWPLLLNLEPNSGSTSTESARSDSSAPGFSAAVNAPTPNSSRPWLVIP
jgi:homocysteine S-methyltransferase